MTPELQDPDMNDAEAQLLLPLQKEVVFSPLSIYLFLIVCQQDWKKTTKWLYMQTWCKDGTWAEREPIQISFSISFPFQGTIHGSWWRKSQVFRRLIFMCVIQIKTISCQFGIRGGWGGWWRYELSVAWLVCLSPGLNKNCWVVFWFSPWWRNGTWARKEFIWIWDPDKEAEPGFIYSLMSLTFEIF